MQARARMVLDPNACQLLLGTDEAHSKAYSVAKVEIWHAEIRGIAEGTFLIGDVIAVNVVHGSPLCQNALHPSQSQLAESRPELRARTRERDEGSRWSKS